MNDVSVMPIIVLLTYNSKVVVFGPCIIAIITFQLWVTALAGRLPRK